MDETEGFQTGKFGSSLLLLGSRMHFVGHLISHLAHHSVQHDAYTHAGRPLEIGLTDEAAKKTC